MAAVWRLCGGCVVAGCAVAAVQSALAVALAACATWFALLALLLEPAAAKFAKGIARPDSPPMGWRSWNFFQCNVNQSIMEAQIDALALPRHGTSLRRLGYASAGLDDCWQSCTPRDMHCLGSATGCSFHDRATGQPRVNTTLFPSLGGMVEHGHSLEVKVGFYQNNCRCHECENHDTCWDENAHYTQDANLTMSLGFDGVKIDSCGNQRDMTEWAAEFAGPAWGNRKLLVESCGAGTGHVAPTLRTPPTLARTISDSLRAGRPWSRTRAPFPSTGAGHHTHHHLHCRGLLSLRPLSRSTGAAHHTHHWHCLPSCLCQCCRHCSADRLTLAL